jgi:threonine dehydratase
VGAFKIRGATNAVFSLSKQEGEGSRRTWSCRKMCPS